jgi:orotate phosphoribosyltransferase
MMNSVAREKLVDIVYKTSYEYRQKEFKLASGSTSNHYVDCKRGLSYAHMRELLGELILDTVADVQFDAVGGLELGAYPIGVAVSDAAYRRGQEIRSFIIRKVPKPHGMQKLVEGRVFPSDKVLIVDDVITRGDSIIKAIRSSREEGFNVVGVVAIVDREQDGGRANIEAEGVWVRAIMTLDELIHAHAIEGQVTGHR